MKYEYISKKMWDDIAQVWHVLVILCKNESANINFPFSSKMHLILVFRESNISLSNLDNPQTYDRLFPKIKNRRVMLSAEIDDILDKRLLFIEKILPDYNLNSNLVKLFKFLRKEKLFTKRLLLPFFNYDYRKLFIAIEQLTEQDDLDKKMFYVKSEDIERIAITSKEESHKNLMRGVILHPIISSACRDQLKNLISNKENGCRLPRLILTVLFNLSFENGLPKDQSKKDEIEPNLIPVSAVYRHFAKDYSADTFIDNLFRCYSFHNERWAHLISLYFMKLGSNAKPRFRKKTREILLTLEKSPNTYEFDNTNESFVHFNASAYAYLRYIITHFEYYSYLAISKDGLVENYPLVNLAYQLEKDSNGELIFSFEKRIEQVLQILFEYKISIDESYNRTFSHLSPQKYTKSKYTFGDEGEGKHFYMTRVITTHITYIDDFRRYLFHSSEFMIFLNSKKSFIKIKTMEEINTYLINKISEYLDVLKNGIMDPTIFSLLETLNEKVIMAKKLAKENIWFNISSSVEE